MVSSLALWQSLYLQGSIGGSLRLRNTANNGGQRVIFSGIQPTGVPHLGNYLGALSNWVHLQRNATPGDKLIFSVVGWHALTLPQDPAVLSSARMDTLAVLLAIGIDPERSIVFHQDQNPCHTELAWLLSCLTPFGKLRRMTTWKARLAAVRNANDETEVGESLLNVGLFTYPILQAADILAYKATHVPVGEDQRQHLELARDVASIFNKTYKSLEMMFPLPQPVVTPSMRILSLKDPTSKMSKSSPDVQSRILLTDNADEIKSKIRGAVTDSIPGITFDPINRPGTSNLLMILASCIGKDAEEVAGRYEGKGHGYLKADVAEAIEEVIRGPREEFRKIRSEAGFLARVAAEGVANARAHSEVTMRQIRECVGLL